MDRFYLFGAPGGDLPQVAETVAAGPGAPDGMRVDSEGNLYCCGPAGVHVFDQPCTSSGRGCPGGSRSDANRQTYLSS